MPPSDSEVAWLHLLKQDSWMTASQVFIAAHEASMVDLSLTTKGLNLNVVTSIMRGYVTQGVAEEKEELRDRGLEPAWKLASEHPESPVDLSFLTQQLTAAAQVPV